MVEPLLSSHVLARFVPGRNIQPVHMQRSQLPSYITCIGRRRRWRFASSPLCRATYNNCSYSSYMPAMAFVGHVAQLFNHAKQMVMLRLSSSHLIRNNFPCHFLSLAISKNCISWEFLDRFPALAAVTSTVPSVVTHTGFRISSWSVMLSSSVYLAASFTSDWWPDAVACSSNSLTTSTVWSEFWYNFSSDLILVSLFSCSTDRRPLPHFSFGRYNKEVRLAGCLPPFSTMIFLTTHISWL